MVDLVQASKYSAPPVIEAVIQIQYSDPLPDAIRKKLLNKLKRFYTHSVEQKQVQARLNLASRDAAFIDSPLSRLTSADQADILVINTNAMTWSRLAPYGNWNQLFDRVERDAKTAHAVTGLRKAVKLGVRYINRIDIPLEDNLVWFENYLNINLSIPEKWPAINNYAWRFEYPIGRGFTAIVQSAVVEPEIPGTGAVILDIDIQTVDTAPTRIDDVLSKFSEMRSLKNEIFESSVSEKARLVFNS